MKIGGCLIVSDDEFAIQQQVRFHLDVQGLDYLFIVDNASRDRTAELIQGLNDPRILFYAADQPLGRNRDQVMTHMVQELLDKLACNWVLPLSQGDYFHSQQFGRTRKVLVNVPEIVDVLQIHTYRFHETALDNPREKNFLRRLKYANLSVPRLIINRRSKDNIQSLVSMGGSLLMKNQKKPVKAVFPPTVLARYHYPTYGPEPFRQSQLFRREGNWYEAILDGTFADRYQSHYVWSADELRNGIEERKVLYIEEMSHLVQRISRQAPVKKDENRETVVKLSANRDDYAYQSLDGVFAD